ncbi:T9SS C-terminal target domain-containing protein [candidate division KSB1 bacterium]|nr:MAG: T9SS C-terminal target domain-containing protein [candidate division KSB1 bacterium]
MKHFTLALITLAAISSSAFSQPLHVEWRHSCLAPEWIGTEIVSVQALADGGCVATGRCCFYLYHGLYHGLYVTRLDSAGNELWERSYWTPYAGFPSWYAQACGISAAPDGGFIVACEISDPGYSEHAALLRLNENGDSLWAGRYSGSFSDCRAVVPTADHSFIACGTAPYPLFKIDSSGTLVWSFSSVVLFSDVKIAPDGSVFATGKDDSGICLFHCSATGDSIWLRNFGWSSLDMAKALQILPSGNLVIAGTTANAGAGGTDAFLICADSTGQSLWQHTYGTTADEFGASVAVTLDGGLLLAGFHHDVSVSAYEGYLVRTDELGDTLWTMLIPDSTNYLVFKSISSTRDSGYFVGGIRESEGVVLKLSHEALAADPRSIPHPSSVRLSSFPNPFNPATTISFSLPSASRTRLAVFDILGREIAVLTDKLYPAGVHQLIFDSASLPSGIYFARIQSGDLIATHKLLLLK